MGATAATKSALDLGWASLLECLGKNEHHHNRYDVVYRGKRRTQKRRRYKKAYKDEAIRLAMQSGISQAQVAKDLDVSAGLLNRCVIEAQRANGGSPGPG